MNMASFIREAGKGAWLFSCDMSRAYHQLPRDPVDWPLVCFHEGGTFFFMDASLPFGLRWLAASYQDTTSIITSHFKSQGFSLLNDNDDFVWGVGWHPSNWQNFKWLQATLDHLGLVGPKHKASPLSAHGVAGSGV